MAIKRRVNSSLLTTYFTCWYNILDGGVYFLWILSYAAPSRSGMGLLWILWMGFRGSTKAVVKAAFCWYAGGGLLKNLSSSSTVPLCIQNVWCTRGNILPDKACFIQCVLWGWYHFNWVPRPRRAFDIFQGFFSCHCDTFVVRHRVLK